MKKLNGYVIVFNENADYLLVYPFNNLIGIKNTKNGIVFTTQEDGEEIEEKTIDYNDIIKVSLKLEEPNWKYIKKQ